MIMLAERPPDGKYGSSLSIDTRCSSTYCQMVKILLAVNLYQTIYIGGGRKQIVQNRTISPLCNAMGLLRYYVRRGNKGKCAEKIDREICIPKGQLQQSDYAKVGSYSLFFIAWFFSWRISMLKLFILIFKTPFSSIFGDRDMIYDLFLLQVCE